MIIYAEIFNNCPLVEALLESVRTQFLQYAEVKAANAQIALDEKKKANDAVLTATQTNYNRMLLDEKVGIIDISYHYNNNSSRLAKVGFADITGNCSVRAS